MEKWGYEISYKKALDGKHKAFRHLFGDFSQSYTDLPRLFLAIEQANHGCVVIWKTTSHSVPNNETFQRVFWAFKPSIEGFANCRPVLSIDGTHLYGKYKGTLLIAMGCDGDLPEVVHDGLPGHPPAEPEVQLALPLGCRWRVPLTRVHNPSGVLLLYRDQLDAQTLDQVMFM